MFTFTQAILIWEYGADGADGPKIGVSAKNWNFSLCACSTEAVKQTKGGRQVPRLLSVRKASSDKWEWQT